MNLKRSDNVYSSIAGVVGLNSVPEPRYVEANSYNSWYQSIPDGSYWQYEIKGDLRRMACCLEAISQSSMLILKTYA